MQKKKTLDFYLVLLIEAYLRLFMMNFKGELTLICNIIKKKALSLAWKNRCFSLTCFSLFTGVLVIATLKYIYRHNLV